MKIILLEHPRLDSQAHYNDVANAPLHACLMNGSIAGVLRQHDFEVAIHDAYLSGQSFEQVFRALSGMEFNLLGVHAVYFWEHTQELFTLLARLKAERPASSIVLYGVFPTFAFRQICSRCAAVDGVIIGEPEQTFLEIARLLKAGASLASAPVAGLACRDGDTLLVSKPRPPQEPLDALPFPVRHRQSLRVIGGSVLGSRGCYGSCTFCCINPFYGAQPGWRGRSPANIGAEIEELLPQLEKKYIYFLDANFFGAGSAGRRRALEIAERLKPYSLLARMGKGNAPDTTRTALRLLREHAVAVTPGFIMFEADATLRDIRDNFELLKNEGLLQRLSHTANVLYHREIALRGMPNFVRLEAQGRLLGTDSLGYEGVYRFSDPGVAFLADIMSCVCRKVLMTMEHTQAAICWKNGENRVTEKINAYLIKSFEYGLGMLQRHELRLDEDTKEGLQEKAMNYIEGLIVEERVCQA